MTRIRKSDRMGERKPISFLGKGPGPRVKPAKARRLQLALPGIPAMSKLFDRISGLESAASEAENEIAETKTKLEARLTQEQLEETLSKLEGSFSSLSKLEKETAGIKASAVYKWLDSYYSARKEKPAEFLNLERLILTGEFIDDEASLEALDLAAKEFLEQVRTDSVGNLLVYLVQRGNTKLQRLNAEAAKIDADVQLGAEGRNIPAMILAMEQKYRGRADDLDQFFSKLDLLTDYLAIGKEKVITALSVAKFVLMLVYTNSKELVEIEDKRAKAQEDTDAKLAELKLKGEAADEKDKLLAAKDKELKEKDDLLAKKDKAIQAADERLAKAKDAEESSREKVLKLEADERGLRNTIDFLNKLRNNLDASVQQPPQKPAKEKATTETEKGQRQPEKPAPVVRALGIEVTCAGRSGKPCGYKWTYKGKDKYADCPKCGASNKVRE